MAWSKESRQSRGYGPEWDRLRVRILSRDGGLCQPCLKEGRPHPGNEVDHIVSKAKAKAMGWTEEQINAESNLQTICREAHEAKTTEEKGHKVRTAIGADGWPVG